MDIVLNQESQNPIYDQIYSQISSQIINGNLKSGMQLPPIRTIANELRISVIPVKMAWEKLDHNGFIKTITGKGTFVAEIDINNVKEKISSQIQDLARDSATKAKALGINYSEFIGLLKNYF